MHSTHYYARQQRFNDRFPLALVALIAILQMFITFAIFALEIAHNYVNVRLTNLFVGFWTSIPFTVLWISMFAVVCCCRRRNCATHAALQNFFSLLFASLLVGLNIVFLIEPHRCFFTEYICHHLTWTDSISRPFRCFSDDLSEDCDKTRIDLIKAQLAMGIAMMVLCLLYLLIYAVVTHRAKRISTPTASQAVMAPVSIYPHQHSFPTALHSNHSAVAPISIPAYAPSAPIQMTTDMTNPNYLPMYPKLPHERF